MGPTVFFFEKVIRATLQNQTQQKPHFLHDQVPKSIKILYIIMNEKQLIKAVVLRVQSSVGGM